ncbi:hypothetical protein L218DRAFT_1074239 [Marasmius fiardii PR-910]|nr:hypothetical protein L218DRAFT_1074239 [Marasmius fiardii PR-910]
MDFFATAHNAQTAQDNEVDNTEDFAKAIQQRFGPGASSILTNFDPSVLPSPKRKLTQCIAGPPAAGGTEGRSGGSSNSSATPSAAVQSSKQVQYPPSHFQSVSPADLETLDAFIVDIRPHAAYASARIPNAISLSVPSTLLKRPLFSLDRLVAMLPSSSARQRFSKWREAKRIVVYDADTSGVLPGGTLPEGSNILGLLRKFVNDDSVGRFKGELFWLKGGFQRVWREQRHLVDTKPPLDEDDDDNNTAVTKPVGGSNASASTGVAGSSSFVTGALRPNGLPSSAFTSSSTIPQVHRPLSTPSLHGRHDTSRPLLSMTMGYNPTTMAVNPFFDVVRQNTELSQGITEGIPLRLPKRVRRRIEELPFQWLKDIGRRAGATNDSPSTSDNQESDYESESSALSESGGGAEITSPASARHSNPSHNDSNVSVEDDVEDVKEASLLSKATTAATVPSSTKASSKSFPASFDSRNTPNAPSDPNNGDSSNSPGSLSPQSSGSVKNKSASNSSLSPNPRSTPSLSGGGSSDSLTDPDPTLVDEGMENLAVQFYRIELAEQRRLMGIMQHHSRESEMENTRALTGSQKSEGEIESQSWAPSDQGKGGELQGSDVQMDVDNDVVQDTEPKTVAESPRRRTMSSPSAPFPYSITAGVEKGAKNRYRHIWPFEHARVRLHQRRPDEVSLTSDSEVSQSSSSLPLALPASTFPTSVKQQQSSISLTSPRSGTVPPSGVPDVTTNVSQPFLAASTAQNTPRYSGMNFGGATPSGPLTGSLFGRSPSPPKPSSAGGAGFTLSLSVKRSRTSSPGGMPPPHLPSHTKPSMSLAPPGGAGSRSLPTSFTQYRNANTGSGGSGGESTATESEWESGTDKTHGGIPGAPRKKESSIERKRREDTTRQSIKEPYDDYVNASYVQPLCTTRRYIATQGPLEATFVDFWTLVYQQNVHVIVMLTREVEGSMVKCGAYWKDEWYGPLRLKLVRIEGKVEEEQERRVADSEKPETGGFFFPVMPDLEKEAQKSKRKKVTIKDKKETRRLKSKSSSPSGHLPPSDLPIIKRTFELRHTAYPDMPPRRIVHFQFLDWPDMNVPDDPRGVLGLIKEVDKAVEEADVVEPSAESDAELGPSKDSAPIKALGVRFFEVDPPRKHSRKPSDQAIDRRTGIAKHALGRENAPVLMHCSAGVGRTGGFIAIDAVLDGVRREIRKIRRAERQAAEKLENARKVLESRATGGRSLDIEMNEASPSGSGSGDGSGDVDMADATIETVPIPAGHGGDVLHVAIHREMGPNPHSERRSKPSVTTAANEVQTPMPMQVDPMSLTIETKESLRKKQREEADTTTRMWSQNVSDQTGNYGSASRVSQARDFAEHGVGSGSLTLPIVSTSSSVAPAPLDSEISSTTASDDSFGFASGFDKRFSGKVALLGTKTSHVTQKSMDGSVTSLSAGSGNGNGKGQSHARTSSSSLAGIHLRAPSVRDRTLSAPSGRPGELFTAVGEGADREPSPLGSRSTNGRSSASPAPWVLSEVEKRADSSPAPFSAADVPPPSRSLSPLQPPAEASSMSRASSIQTSGGNSGSGSNKDSRDLRRKIADRASNSPPANVDSGGESGSGSGIASVPPTTTTSGSGTGTGSRSGSGIGSGFGSASGSGPGSRSRSVSVAESSPLEAGVLPTAGTADIGSKSLQGFNKKLDKVASAAAEAATSKLKSTEIQRAGFDYTEPRPLHQHNSPVALSIFKVPLWEVVQDMREQRMSLCQSLRQYVFVHAVVVEGALMILDEENEKDGIPSKKRSRKKNRTRSRRKALSKKDALDEVMSDVQPGESRADVSSIASSRRSKTDNGGSISTGTTSNKRQASPTELPQEDKTGGQLLHKKPSLKRKPGTSSDESLPTQEVLLPSSPL